MPPVHVRFRRFTSLNTTIRLRDGEIYVSLSDLLEGAPESVLHAIAHILLAKLYRKPIDARAKSALQTLRLLGRRHATNRADPPRARQQALLRPRGPLLQPRRSLRLAQHALLRWAPRPPRPHLERAPRQALARPLRRRPQHHRRQPRLRPPLQPSLRHRVPALPRDASPQAPRQDARPAPLRSLHRHSRPKNPASRNSPKPSPSSSGSRSRARLSVQFSV